MTRSYLTDRDFDDLFTGEDFGFTAADLPMYEAEWHGVWDADPSETSPEA